MMWLTRPEFRLLVALAGGLLIGAEREQRRAQQPSGGSAGLRTFGLLGLLGGLLAYFEDPLLVAAGALVVGAIAFASLQLRPKENSGSGLATELAMVVTYGIGAVALTAPVLAASAAVIVATLLASAEPLHELVRVKVSRTELRDGLVLLLFALVLLPTAPDSQVGPFGAINPQSLVRLVLVLMVVSGAGYIAPPPARWPPCCVGTPSRSTRRSSRC